MGFSNSKRKISRSKTSHQSKPWEVDRAVQAWVQVYKVEMYEVGPP